MFTFWDGVTSLFKHFSHRCDDGVVQFDVGGGTAVAKVVDHGSTLGKLTALNVTGAFNW